jgi:hypothetical protein
MGDDKMMDKEDIEYLVCDIMMNTRSITLLEDGLAAIMLDRKEEGVNEIINTLQEQLQLLYVNREISKQELMSMGDEIIIL